MNLKNVESFDLRLNVLRVYLLGFNLSLRRSILSSKHIPLELHLEKNLYLKSDV
ncbi:MAG: hypothetical protein ABFC34_03495 [Methanobacterium sp.]